MPPALPVVRVAAPGRNAGKTELATRLVRWFVEKGYRVVAVKRSHHAITPDVAGKDSDRLAKAGAAAAIFWGADGLLERRAGYRASLAELAGRFTGEADIVIVEGMRDETHGARIMLTGPPPAEARIVAMDGEPILTTNADEVELIATTLERHFCLSPYGDEQMRRLIRHAAALHGHYCPGITLGIRMALAGTRALGLSLPVEHRRLHVTVETGRCATDAIAAATGCSAGRQTLRLVDYGKMAATFLDTASGRAVRVLALESSRGLAGTWGAEGGSPRHRQAIAYARMPDELLFTVKPVRVQLPEERRERATCANCGESVAFGRYVERNDGPRCIPCAGAATYWEPLSPGTLAGFESPG
ncbi:MAG: hypothetical protein Kow0010_08380 [Dehalococcoidia bacterium]